MNATERAIRDAMKGRYYNPNYFYSRGEEELCGATAGWEYEVYCAIFLDPDFWRCYGKSKGWQDCSIDDESCGWIAEWFQFIRHLARGHTPESFFADLEAQNT